MSRDDGSSGWTRREYLRGLGGGATVALAGCPLADQSPSTTATEPDSSPDNPSDGYGNSTLTDRSAPERRTWSKKIAEGIVANPTLHDGLVVAGTTEGTVVGLSATTGETQWTFDTGTESTVNRGPVVNDGVGIVGLQNGRAIAFDIGDRSERWRRKIGDFVDSTPVVLDGKVFVGSRRIVEGTDGPTLQGHCYSLSASDGDTLWRSPIEGGVVGRPIVAGERVIVAGAELAHLDRSAGAKMLSRKLDGYASAGPVLNDGKVAVLTDTTLSAFESSSETLLWDAPIEGGRNSRPVWESGSIFTRSGRTTVASFADEGTQQWEIDLRGTLLSDVIVHDDALHCATTTLHVLSIDDGDTRWTADLDAEAPGLAVGTDRVYAGTLSGRIVAFDR